MVYAEGHALAMVGLVEIVGPADRIAAQVVEVEEIEVNDGTETPDHTLSPVEG